MRKEQEMKIYNNVTYDRDKMYDEEIAKAAAKGDYLRAGMLEQQRNAKIDGEKLSYDKTYDYSRYLEPGADSGFGISLPKSTKGADSGNGITADDEDYEYKGGRGFKYNPSEDKAYQGLVKQVQKNAEFVGDNTLGRFAAMTGGVPSSYAVSAAAGAQMDALDDIYDIYAEREGEAYDRYMTQEQIDYSRYLDEVDREAAKDAAAEDARRWDLDHELSKKQIEADVGYTEAKTAEQVKANEYTDDLYLADIDSTKANTELTRAKTDAQVTENNYADMLNEAELARIYADTDLTKAKTSGQVIDNKYAPLAYLDELTGEDDTSTEEMTVASILNKANSGAYLTDAEYAMLDRAKENILARLGKEEVDGDLSAEEMNILRAFGYTSGQLAGQITYDSAASTFTAPEGEATAKNMSGLLSKFPDLKFAAARGSQSLEDAIKKLRENNKDIDDDAAYYIYSYYANAYGW